MKGRIRIAKVLASRIASTPGDVFRQGVAITLLVIFTFASILPTAFASTKEKVLLSVPKNVRRSVKAKPIFQKSIYGLIILKPSWKATWVS